MAFHKSRRTWTDQIITQKASWACQMLTAGYDLVCFMSCSSFTLTVILSAKWADTIHKLFGLSCKLAGRVRDGGGRVWDVSRRKCSWAPVGQRSDAMCVMMSLEVRSCANILCSCGGTHPLSIPNKLVQVRTLWTFCWNNVICHLNRYKLYLYVPTMIGYLCDWHLR